MSSTQKYHVTSSNYEEHTSSSTVDLVLRLNALDIVVIIIFFILVLGVGVWSMIKSNRNSVKGYFLAGKSMAWWPVGLSLYASNISSNSFIGLAGSGAAGGVAVSAYELTGLYDLIFLGWIFVPVYMASGIYTMPEYMKKRFGGNRIRIYLSCLCMILYIFTKISIDLYSGAIFIQQSLGWQLYPSILSLLVITSLFAITGGLTAVIYTDTIEAIVMVAGGIVLMILGFIEIGGYSGLKEKWPEAIPNDAYNETCGMPNDDAFSIFRPANDPDYPWPGVVFGVTILSTWYFCTDQVLVQRSLAAKNLTHAKGGSLLAAALKVLPLFLMVMPGMISRSLYPNEVACATPEVCQRVCENAAGCTNIAYPRLVMGVMPQGLRGLMIAAILAALMSSLTSVFNSSATIFTVDIWRSIRPKADEREMTIVGRIFVLALTAISVAWIPILTNLQSGKMFEYIQSISSYLSPPICSTYLLAIFWKRINEPGAFWGLLFGLIIGIVRMLMDFTISGAACGFPDPRPNVIGKVAFLHFAIILFCLSAIISITVSLITEPVERHRLPSLTWWTRFQKPAQSTTSVYENHVEMDGMLQNHTKIEDVNENGDLDAVKEEDLNTNKEISITFKERLVDWFCGSQGDLVDDVQADQLFLGKDALIESNKSRQITNIFAILIMCMGAYVIGFFS